MSKKGRKNRKKSKRNKHYHSNDDSLPFIEVAPNLEEKPVSDLPKVIVDCDMNQFQMITAFLSALFF